MSNQNTANKRSLSVLLGAAFLMATSAIGPGFLTQTSQFTAKYLASFAFVIVCVILMDMIAQTNIWSIIGASGLRGQEIANRVLPGLGYVLIVLVVIGGLAFNIGNVGGVALGFNAMVGLNEKLGAALGGAKKMVILAGAVNGLILPISLGCILLACRNKKIVGEEYKHPVWMQVLGWLVALLAAWLAVKALPGLKNLFI